MDMTDVMGVLPCGGGGSSVESTKIYAGSQFANECEFLFQNEHVCVQIAARMKYPLTDQKAYCVSTHTCHEMTAFRFRLLRAKSGV